MVLCAFRLTLRRCVKSTFPEGARFTQRRKAKLKAPGEMKGIETPPFDSSPDGQAIFPGDPMKNKVSDPPPDSDEKLGATAEAVAATTRKLEKAALLGEYFQELSDADLARAARYFAGQRFALKDARTTNVGGSILAEALSTATGLSLENLSPRYVRLGDAGDVAFEAVAERGRVNAPSLTLEQTEALLARLSETRGARGKQKLLIEVMTRATPLEAKYLVKLLTGDLRIGLREGLVEDAIARAFAQPLAEVATANMLTGDIAEAAARARAGELTDVAMRLFHPLKFMLATPAADLNDITRTMPGEFFVEDKFDGIRAQAHVQERRAALFLRPRRARPMPPRAADRAPSRPAPRATR